MTQNTTTTKPAGGTRPATVYQIANAVDKVYGYYFPRPGESAQEAFDRTKAETLANLQRDLDTVRGITLDHYLKATCDRLLGAVPSDDEEMAEIKEIEL